MLDKLSFGSFNKRIANAVSPFEWFSRDAAEVQKYIDDELCGFVVLPVLRRSADGGRVRQQQGECFASAQDLPLLIISGEMDPVGG
jgi:alpha-beta hydrolase superfamily lysophospholipase